MPRPLVGLHPEAIAEAAATATWYRERSESAALAFLKEFDRAIDRIAAAPGRWPKYVGGTRRFLMHRFPFSVVYRIEGEAIQVLAVAHARRRPGYWKGR